MQKVCSTSIPEIVLSSLENRFAAWSFSNEGEKIYVENATMQELDEMKEFVNGFKAGWFARANATTK